MDAREQDSKSHGGVNKETYLLKPLTFKKLDLLRKKFNFPI